MDFIGSPREVTQVKLSATRSCHEITVHIGQIIRVSAIFIFAKMVKIGNILYCVISPDLFIGIWY